MTTNIWIAISGYSTLLIGSVGFGFYLLMRESWTYKD